MHHHHGGNAYSMDSSPAISKQMALMDSTLQARQANNRSLATGSGINSGLAPGGLHGSTHDTHHQQPQQQQQQQQQQQDHNTMSSPPQRNTTTPAQRRRNFFTSLSAVHLSRGTPLPPSLTGVPYPNNFNPANSVWNMIECSDRDVGCIRLAGRDVDLLRLWGYIAQAGGSNKITQHPQGWKAVVHALDLPDEIPPIYRVSGEAATDVVLAQLFAQILGPFEETFNRNVQEQHRRAQAARQAGAQQPPPQSRNAATNSNQPGANDLSAQSLQSATPQAPHHRPPTMAQSLSGDSTSELTSHPTTETPFQSGGDHLEEPAASDQDTLGIKRKHDGENGDSKRARQKTDSGTAEANASGSQDGPRPQQSRRKIEYVPFVREIDTHGGRDLKYIDSELENQSQPQRRLLRDLNDWGTVDIEALTLSIRSRISIELSYALTTLTLMSTMRGPTEGAGFPVHNCGDLLDELLDLIEDKAFVGQADEDMAEDGDLAVTHRDLTNAIRELESDPFGALKSYQGSRNDEDGPRQRPANIILAVVNILRNLVVFSDNIGYLARHKRMLDLLLRICGVVALPSPHARSPVLSVGDLISIRRDVLYILGAISPEVDFKSCSLPPATISRLARRVFQLTASYLVHPADAVTPLTYVISTGAPLTPPFKLPGLADISLSVFNAISQRDAHRQIFAKAVSQDSLWRLFEALIHRLPITDPDFSICARENWSTYIDRIVMAVYSLAFLAPPEVKKKFKTDRSLGFDKVMVRLIQKYLHQGREPGRDLYMMSVRRAIEAMKVVDDCEDSFDTSHSVLPVLSFGMGYGEVTEGTQHSGPGILSGRRELTWELLMLVRDSDELVFGELESLARVD